MISGCDGKVPIKPDQLRYAHLSKSLQLDARTRVFNKDFVSIFKLDLLL